jgi:general secretion pathway protein K
MHKFRGSALITSLFIMTLAAIAAVSMSFRLNIEIKRTNILVDANKLQLAIISVPFWAMAELQKAVSTKPNTPLKLRFPHVLDPKLFSNERINIKGQIEDLQGNFNINMLKDRENLITFIKLLQITNPKLNLQSATKIASASREWISPRKPGQINQGLESYYMKQTPPYFMSHLSMVSVSEWRLVQGVSQQIYNNTSPYLSALPPPTKININSTSLPILMALGFPKQLAQKILKKRQEKPYPNLNELNKFPEIEKFNIQTNNLSVDSNYFLTLAMAELGRQTLSQYTTLEIKILQKKVDIHIIAQSLNSY